MHQGRFTPYKNALATLSARTGAPLPSLVLSFAILHEVTAIVPLIAVFYGSRALGIGEGIINTISTGGATSSGYQSSWTKQVLRGWVAEGDAWAARVGKRYGFFGFEKETSGTPDQGEDLERPPLSSHLPGDVANAIVAYGVTKALIPLRIGVSLYLSPAFSRRIIEPTRRTMLRPFRRT